MVGPANDPIARPICRGVEVEVEVDIRVANTSEGPLSRSAVRS